MTGQTRASDIGLPGEREDVSEERGNQTATLTRRVRESTLARLYNYLKDRKMTRMSEAAGLRERERGAVCIIDRQRSIRVMAF